MAHSIARNSFIKAVYMLVQQIPYGRVTTYGTIAHHLGTAKSARMVGWALRAAVNQPAIPAHRVVNRNGYLTGKHHFAGEAAMERLLAAEGIVVVDDRVQNFEKVYWRFH